MLDVFLPRCFLLLICAIYWTIPNLAALLTSPCLADCVCIFPALMLHQVESHVSVDIWYPEQHHVVLLNSKLHKIARIVVPMTFGSFGSHVRRLKGALLLLLSKAAYNSNLDDRNQQINNKPPTSWETGVHLLAKSILQYLSTEDCWSNPDRGIYIHHFCPSNSSFCWLTSQFWLMRSPL